jgi:hypothetical protein
MIIIGKDQSTEFTMSCTLVLPTKKHIVGTYKGKIKDNSTWPDP